MPAPFVTIAHLLFDSVEAFQQSWSQRRGILADSPNYTDIQPTVEVNEVKL